MLELEEELLLLQIIHIVGSGGSKTILEVETELPPTFKSFNFTFDSKLIVSSQVSVADHSEPSFHKQIIYRKRDGYWY